MFAHVLHLRSAVAAGASKTPSRQSSAAGSSVCTALPSPPVPLLFLSAGPREAALPRVVRRPGRLARRPGHGSKNTKNLRLCQRRESERVRERGCAAKSCSHGGPASPSRTADYELPVRDILAYKV